MAAGGPDPSGDTRPAPGPFRQFILKIHSRCDLACDHCYVYTMADQRWRERPLVMSRRIIDQTAGRVAEHVRAHRLSSVDIVLHGGEPLLAGPERIEYCISRIRSAVGHRCRVGAHVQTNGTRLSTGFLELFRRLGIRVSVSVDGDRTAHDRHRRHPDGRGSHAAVSRSLRELGRSRYRPLFSGLLCTIDLRNDPVTTYESLLAFAPPVVDFLLPHGNWSAPPPGRQPGVASTPYGDWLARVFDRWYGAARPETRVRLLEELVGVLLGGQSRLEGVGLSPAGMVVVETDGGIEQSDMLASAFAGAGATGLHVARDTFDAARVDPRPAGRWPGPAGLAPGCRGCPVRRTCGGGLLPHRYHRDTGFANPSVYCPDLYRLITHIRHRLATDLAALRRARP
jgi:uncharacterized protein